MKKRTNMNVDMELVEKVAAILGTKTTTATVHAALDEVIKLQLRRELADHDFPDLTPEALEEMRRGRDFPEFRL
jgi:Arc/MetJ family transcription regulator